MIYSLFSTSRSSGPTSLTASTSLPIPSRLTTLHMLFFAEAYGYTQEDIEQVVADYSDAFWIMPLAFNERRFQVVRWRGLWIVLLRTGQGARGAGLTFCYTSGLTARLCQSLFSPLELLLQVFTDDPHMTLMGSQRQRDLYICIMVYSWIVLGFEVALRKARRGALCGDGLGRPSQWRPAPSSWASPRSSGLSLR